MPMKPLAEWEATYEPKMKQYYSIAEINPGYKVERFWQDWIDSNAQGIASAAPIAGSNGTTTRSALKVSIPIGGGGALLIATAWRNWYLAISWSTPPPSPPFSAITSVKSSALGTSIAFATLVAGLTAECASIPPAPISFKVKAKKMATLFRAATVSAGIEVTGLGIGGPPPPLFLPLSPVN